MNEEEVNYMWNLREDVVRPQLAELRKCKAKLARVETALDEALGGDYGALYLAIVAALADTSGGGGRMDRPGKEEMATTYSTEAVDALIDAVEHMDDYHKHSAVRWASETLRASRVPPEKPSR
jgi:hypothetical protein